MRQLTIAGETFEVAAPYVAGHSISEIEAKVLNQTRAENVGNNLRSTIKDMLEKNASAAEMQKAVAEYDNAYTFATPGTRTVVDPFERECLAVAREAIKAELASQGRKLKDLADEDLDAALTILVDQEDVQAEAKKRLKAKEKKVKISLANLNLGTQPAA